MKNIDDIKRRPIEEQEAELAATVKHLEWANKRARIRGRIQEVVDTFMAQLQEVDALEAELVATDGGWATHTPMATVHNFPTPTLVAVPMDEPKDWGNTNASKVYEAMTGEPDAFGQDDDDAPQATIPPEDVPKVVFDDKDAARVAKTPAKVQGPVKELPPPPKATLLNYLGSKKAQCHVTLSGDLVSLDSEWDPADKDREMTSDFGAEPQDAYDFGLAMATTAGALGLEGQVRVWANMPGPTPTESVFWHANLTR